MSWLYLCWCYGNRFFIWSQSRINNSSSSCCCCYVFPPFPCLSKALSFFATDDQNKLIVLYQTGFFHDKSWPSTIKSQITGKHIKLNINQHLSSRTISVDRPFDAILSTSKIILRSFRFNQLFFPHTLYYKRYVCI